MGLGILVVGLVVFLANHLFITRRDARAAAIARFGIHTYRALFSVVSIVGLALIVWGYSEYRAHGMISVSIKAILTWIIWIYAKFPLLDFPI